MIERERDHSEEKLPEDARAGSSDEWMKDNNARFVENYTGSRLGVRPARRLAVVACMDSRLDVFGAMGLGLGEAHVIRNAGGIVTDDVVRSLLISQRLLGTRDVILIHHTDCGMVAFTDEDLKDAVEEETGQRPPFALGAFSDLERSLEDSIRRIVESPYLLSESVRGFIYEVETGRLVETTE